MKFCAECEGLLCMALATTAEHARRAEEMFEALESGSSERFQASDEAAKPAIGC
jgi:hypothetical protein